MFLQCPRLQLESVQDKVRVAKLWEINNLLAIHVDAFHTTIYQPFNICGSI